MKQFFLNNSIIPMNAGLFVSSGIGTHPTRVIDSWELILVERGVLAMVEGGVPYRLSAGETLLLAPGVQHGGNAPYPPDLAFYWIHFTLARGQRKGECVEIPKHVRLPEPERLIYLFRRFLDDQERSAMDRTAAGLLISLMLCEVARALRHKAGSERSAAWAGAADAWMRAHCREAITAGDVAKALGCNADYLGREFRRVHGMTLTDALNRCRMGVARKMLVETVKNLDAVARESGYSDAGYFRRVFKRETGMTAKAFRRLHARVHRNSL